MHRLETSIDIDATAARVWSLLMDFSAYRRWNPFVRSIAGDPRVGQALVVAMNEALKREAERQ